MEWKTVKLGDCLSKIIDNRGKTPKDLAVSGHPLLEINAVSKNNKYPLYGEAKKYVDDVVYSTWFRSGHPQYGDILVPTVGTLGSVAYVDRNDCCVAQNLIALRANADICDSAYLYYLLCNPQIVKRLLNLDIGAVQASIKVPHLLALEISLPPFETQRRIAAILSSLDDKIENNNRINRNLEAQAQALFKSWFVDFEPWGGTMPEDWREYRLGDFVPVKTGKKDANVASKTGLYPFFSCAQDILYTDNYSFNGDAILVAGNGDFNVKWYRGKFEAYQRTYVLIPTDSRFLGWLFYLVKYNLDRITSGARGSVIKFITKGNLEDFVFVAPKELEKCDIIDKFNSINAMIEQNKNENARLVQLRDTLLPKLMKGEIEL